MLQYFGQNHSSWPEKAMLLSHTSINFCASSGHLRCVQIAGVFRRKSTDSQTFCLRRKWFSVSESQRQPEKDRSEHKESSTFRNFYCPRLVLGGHDGHRIPTQSWPKIDICSTPPDNLAIAFKRASESFQTEVALMCDEAWPFHQFRREWMFGRQCSAYIRRNPERGETKLNCSCQAQNIGVGWWKRLNVVNWNWKQPNGSGGEWTKRQVTNMCRLELAAGVWPSRIRMN